MAALGPVTVRPEQEQLLAFHQEGKQSSQRRRQQRLPFLSVCGGDRQCRRVGGTGRVGLAGRSCGLALTCDVSRAVVRQSGTGPGVIYSEGVENWIERSGCDRTGH